MQNQGKDIADSELLDYISESSTMSKSLADYGEQKSCAVTTAKRLGDFLGTDIVKHKGLRCQYVVACEPRVRFLFYLRRNGRYLKIIVLTTSSAINWDILQRCLLKKWISLRYIVETSLHCSF